MTLAPNNMHRAGIRKAAILVASLDQAAADLLLDQLSPDNADRVRQAAMAIDPIDAEERQRVIDEFRRIGPMVPDACPPGIELDGLPAEPFRSAGAELAPDGDETIANAEPETSPFGFLREAEQESLWQILVSERPQTIALVLSHLAPERAGELVSRFAPSLQVEVVRRLADLENTDTEILREIEQALEARLLRQFAIERGRAAGPDAVARILAACDSRVVAGILENLAACDEPLAERLGRRPLEFDDLAQLDDAALLAVFRAAEPEVAQTALLGAPPRMVERILRRMIPAEAKILRRKLDSPGPIRLSDVEDARQQIAALAQRMARSNPQTTALAA
jgi:flagellar motor switch protein FliG